MSNEKVFKVVRDAYGRRILPASILEETNPSLFGRGLLSSEGALRTNKVLLGTIAQGGDVVPTVSDPAQYYDAGHALVGDSEHEREQCAARLPLHSIGISPERLLTVDSQATRDFVDGVVSRALEERAAGKGQSSAGSGDAGSDSASGEA